MLARLLCALLLVAPCSFAQQVPSQPSAPGQLKAVVILTRHGVRAPTSLMSDYVWGRTWPLIQQDWHVKCCADLTPRGADLVTLLGAYYRSYYAGKNLFSQTGCLGHQLYIWADNEERTMGTAKALSLGLQGSGCPDQVEHLTYTPSICPDGCKRIPKPGHPKDPQDPLFHPLPSRWSMATGSDKQAVAKAAADLSNDARYTKLLNTYQASLQALQATLGCQNAPCNLFARRHNAASGYPKESDAIVWTGNAFAVGSTASEVFLLEYANRMPCSQVGWNSVVFDGPNPECNGPGQSFRLMQEVHTAYFGLVQQPTIVAQLQGSNLAYHIREQLLMARFSKTKKLIIFSGHDTNIANVAALLNLHWTLPDLPDDDTPPAGALVFELYSGASPDDDYVRIFYVHQSVPQLRSLEPGKPAEAPLWANLTLDGCNEDCGFDQFSTIVRKAYRLRFVTRTRAR